MCIRDSPIAAQRLEDVLLLPFPAVVDHIVQRVVKVTIPHRCLLYTSDAADERSSVDLGGRRIIKKKNTEKIEGKT